MEKFIFLAAVKDKLTEMNIPKETVDKHVKIFEECFTGKSAEEIDKVIEGAGGIDGVVTSVANLEYAKKQRDSVSIENQNPTISEKEEGSDASHSAASQSFEDESAEPQLLQTNVAIPAVVADTEQKQPQTEEDPDGTEKNTELNEHIKDAEQLTDTIERLKIPTVQESDEEYSIELSDYDFEKLFAEKLSKPESWIKKLREKINLKTYKRTLPLAILLDLLLFVFVITLFPLVICSAVAFSVVYLVTLIAGVTFAVIPTGYGIYMCFKSMPIASYELSIGIISAGVTMIVCILLYNYVKRLVPFLLKQLKKLFMLCVRISKIYFGKIKKEEN